MDEDELKAFRQRIAAIQIPAPPRPYLDPVELLREMKEAWHGEAGADGA